MEDDNTKIKEIICSTARSVGASFPGIASIAQGWNEWESSKRWKYFKQFVEETSLKFKKLDEKLDRKIDLDSEETRHLFSLTLDKVMREHREEKRKKFAEFFVKTTCMGEKITFDEKRFFLEVLDELNEFDLNLLKLIKENGKLKVQSLVNTELELGTHIVSISKLQSKGLIAETSPSSADSPYNLRKPLDKKNYQNRWIKKWFEVLPPGKKFLESLTISDLLKDENTN